MALADYAAHVWLASEGFLATRTAADLNQVLAVGRSGQAQMGMASDELPTLAMVEQALLINGNQHLGELWLLRALQELPGGGL